MRFIARWIDLYQKLRTEGSYPQADELREMLRRMGYELRVKKDFVEAINHNEIT